MNTQIVLPKISLSRREYLASRIACFILILAWIYYFPGRSFPVTLIAGGAILLFSFQFIFQFKLLNWFLGILMLILSLYFSLAVLSEYGEFKTLTNSALQLLLIGLGMSLTGGILSVIMIAGLVRSFEK
jgi:hypothetical protein